MCESWKKLEYLDLDIKAYHRIRVEQFNLPCYFKNSVEHVGHSDTHPQLNLITDLLLNILITQKQCNTASSSSYSPKHLREIYEKLDYLKEARDLVQLKHLKVITSLESQVQKLEQAISQINERLQSLL